MINIFTALMTKFAGSAFSTDVGGRIYLDEAPAGAQFPYCVFFIVSDIPQYPGNKTMESILIQFSLFSTSQAVAEITTMLTDLRALLDDCSLTITSSTLVYFIRENFTTQFEDITTPDGTVGVRHYIQEYEISTVK